MGFEPGTFRLRSERAKRWAIRADINQTHKSDLILPECAIKSYLYYVLDIDDFSCIFVIWYLYGFAIWLIKVFADCKELVICTHHTTFYYI